MKQVQKPEKVIIIGGGLSGLTAANHLLKKKPETQVIVLQAMDYLGGRTKSISSNGCTFDLGGSFIGPTQHHVIDLAIQSKNQLIPVQCKGKKIIEFKNVTSTYTSDIPSNVNIIALLQLNFTIWKVNRMAKKVPTLNPKDCELGHYWDSMSCQNWIDKNICFEKVKLMMQAALRVILGVELCEVSFLYFLWYVNQSKDFDNLINVENGLQQKKTKLGTQHMSIYLGEEIKKKGGQIKLNFYVKQIHQKQNKCSIIGQNKQVLQCDYLIMAMPPSNCNKINFTPQLSSQKKLICSRSFMGTVAKIIVLYKKRYWKDQGFTGQSLSDCYDSPVMNCFDDTKINQKGEQQPALIVFIGGALYRFWKDRADLKQAIADKLASYYQEEQMKNPIKMLHHRWQDERSINGSPVGVFPPGTLSQVENMRKPQGRIHWAGTEMATVSVGFMDGAIQSGKKAAEEIVERINNPEIYQQKKSQNRSKQLPYTKYIRYNKFKCFEWI